MILDLGIESETPVLSASSVSIGETSPNASATGQIVRELDSWAKKSRVNKSRVLVIRAQNWATRTTVRDCFSVPLFNNYSGILTGQAKSLNSRKWLSKRIQLNGVSADYGLNVKDPYLFRNGVKFLNHILSFLGPKNSLKIKKHLRNFLDF